MAQFSLDELELAFGYHIVRLIIGADARIGIPEIDLLERRFPRDLMEASGFIDAEGDFTARHEQAMREALERLPSELPEDHKLELLATFVDASLSDDHLQSEESAILRQAAALLGLTPEEFKPRLRALLGRRHRLR